MKHKGSRLFALTLFLGLLALVQPVSADDQFAITTAPTQRDVRMRAVTWDYQPGYPRRGLLVAQKSQPQETTPSKVPLKASPSVDYRVSDAWEMEPLEAYPQPPTDDLKIGTSIDLGFQFSKYEYTEPDVSGIRVTAKGNKIGGTAQFTYGLSDDFFVRANARFADGEVDYTGSGTHDNEPDWLFEVRALGGKNFYFGQFAVAPYAGIGYRNLYNDGRGVTSTGALGYRRESQYLFVPIGVMQQMRVGKDMKLSLDVEVDPVLAGWQFSQLSDVPGFRDVTNKQTDGYGVRGEMLFHWWRFSAGPFFNYWNISQSKPADCVPAGPGLLACWAEPHNHTIEYGLHVRYRLY